MNSRELTLISSASIFGALASAIALRFLFPTHTKQPRRVTEKRSQRSPFDATKRSDYLSWDDYFMAIAFLSAERSKDPNRQVGACLVSENGIILGLRFFTLERREALRVLIIKIKGKNLSPTRGAELTLPKENVAEIREESNFESAWEYAALNSKTLGIGYNGFPRGCSDDKLPWAKKSKIGNPLETKYPYVCHAEVNAILNTNHASVAGQRLYVTMFPCNECAKIIIQSGVAEVVYFVEKKLNDDVAYTASRKLLSLAGVKIRKHQPDMDQILIKFEES